MQINNHRTKLFSISSANQILLPQSAHQTVVLLLPQGQGSFLLQSMRLPFSSHQLFIILPQLHRPLWPRQLLLIHLAHKLTNILFILRYLVMN